MKIAFFEIQNWERDILSKVLRGQELMFFTTPLNEFNIDKIREADAISIFIYSKIDKKILDKLPNLKYITTRSMGFDHIDLEECKNRKIKVSNAPHYGDNSVAEHTFGLILSLSRNIHKALIRTLDKNYKIEGLKGFDLKGKTLGVVGTGRIGSHVVKIAHAFEMNVLAVVHHPPRELRKYCKFVSMNELLRKSDIITLHVPFCKENFHLINKSALSKVKKGALLVNTSRGPVVDTKALLWALENNILLGVGLDVLEGEELIKEEKELLHDLKKLNLEKMRQLAIDHRILHDERVVFTPHIAFYTEEAVQKILQTTIENIKSFMNGRAINKVN